MQRTIFAVLLIMLLMAGSSAAQEASPTPAPIATEEYIVRRGETLNMIAQRYGTTIRQLLTLNPDITNADLVYAGQAINVPAPGSPTLAPTSTALPAEATLETTVEATSEATAEATTAPASVALEYGIEVSFAGAYNPSVAEQVVGLGLGWAKLEVRWENLQPNEGDPILFQPLDDIVSGLDSQGINILFTVTNAPAWTRTLDEEIGPPDNLAQFAAFIRELAAHYTGIVDAYQIWNEPNIRSKWKSPIHPIGAAQYIDLLRQSYEAVKAVDSNALVISAGLAPTGFNDAYNAQVGNLGVNAVDDRIFLRDLYTLGLANYSDGVGAHPMGWANPPEATCCNASEGVTTHFESPQFYFLNTVQDYRAIMVQAGDTSTPIWITKFGWGTSEDLGVADDNNVFVTYTTMTEQADYITRAYQLAGGLGYVGPMFVYNLNSCLVLDLYNTDGCYYSLLDPNGVPRPAFAALESLNKLGTAEQPVVEVTTEPISEATVEVTTETALEATAEVTPEPAG
jgi:polysaccharide biosynthesis protein PslG